MKKSVLVIFLCFIILGATLASITPTVLAKDGDGGGDSSGGDSGSSGSDSGGDDSGNSGSSDSDDSSDDSSGGSSRSGGGDSDDSSDDLGRSDSSRSGDDDSDDSGSSESGSSGRSKLDKVRTTIINEDGQKVEVRTRTRSRDGKEEVERIHRFVDADGNQVKIVVKIETEDGKTETINKRTITDQNGVEVVIRTKTELRDDRERVTHSIEVNGIEVPTKLSVREEIKNNRSRIKAKLSTGAEQDIIFLPDEALQVAFDELTSQNITIELREITEGNTVKAVFSAKTIKPGRLLGIFNTQVNLETLIDTETGEIIKTNRPFWAFLVIGENNTTLCHIPPGNPDNRKTLTVGIPAVKAHLGHGDSLDACVSVCGDGILVEGEEICEGDIRDCSTAEGYLGTETCNAACDGFDSCVAVESCGDGFINGPETCDDTNAIDGDGCDAACQIEATGNGTTTP